MKKYRKYIIMISLILVVCGVIIACFVLSKKPVLRYSDCVEYSFSGFDGYGTVTVGLNYDKINEIIFDNGDDFKANYNNKYNQISKYLHVEVNKSSNLSNGDKIKIRIKVDKKELENEGYTYKGERTKVITVSGLEEIKKVDIFEGVDVDFDGMSPEAYASLVINDDNKYSKYVSFNIDKTTNIKNGDIITVSISDEDAEQMRQLGMNPIKTSVTFEAKCDTYAKSVNEIPENEVESLKDDVKKAVVDYVNNMTQKGTEMSELAFEGGYFSYSDKSLNMNGIGYGGSTHNRIALVYSVKLLNEEYNLNGKYYFTIAYNNIILKADGGISKSQTYVNSYNLIGETEVIYYRNVAGHTFDHFFTIKAYDTTDPIKKESMLPFINAAAEIEAFGNMN